MTPKQDIPDELGLLDQDHDALPHSRWPAGGLDVFWPILAVVLVVAVVFVASVAHNSMNSVGVPVAQIGAGFQSPRPTARADTLMIVQVSSHTTRSAAQAATQELIDRGFDARVLKSDNYRPLNRGYYVVFTGPYARTAAGRAEAKRVRAQVQIDGALVRDIHPREDDEQ